MDARNIDSTDGTWIRSSRCGPKQGNCVELNGRADEIAIRDSKSGGGSSLIFDHTHWTTFVKSIKA